MELAVLQEDILRLKALLEGFPNAIETRDGKNRLPLHTAAEMNQSLDVVALLVHHAPHLL